MPRLICALVLVLLITTPSFGQQSLVGTYKLVSLVVEVDGKPYEPMGKAPHGYLVLTPTHFIYFFTAENRKFGTSVDEKAALLDSLVAYAGVYRVEGDKMFLSYRGFVCRKGEGNDSGGNIGTFWKTVSRSRQAPRHFPEIHPKRIIRQLVWEKIE